MVFLLLIFFMLASRFAAEHRLDLAAAGGGAGYSGPPRLVEINAGGVALNGAPIDLEALPAALDRLSTDRGQIVVLRPAQDADVQRMVVVMDALNAAGFVKLALVE